MDDEDYIELMEAAMDNRMDMDTTLKQYATAAFNIVRPYIRTANQTTQLEKVRELLQTLLKWDDGTTPLTSFKKRHTQEALIIINTMLGDK